MRLDHPKSGSCFLAFGDLRSLMNAMDGLDAIFSSRVETVHEHDGHTANSDLRRVDLENHIEVTHAKIMANYKKQLEDHPKNPCCSCNMLFHPCLVLHQAQQCTCDCSRPWESPQDRV